MQHFSFPDLGKEKLCSILVFWECMFQYSSPDKSWQCCEQGRCWTYSHHCQIADKNPSKDGRENFGGFVYVLDGFPQRDFVLWVFICSIIFSLFFSGYHAEGYHAPPIPYGYHAESYHARIDTFKLTGYHVCRVTTPELPRSKQTSGYRRVITPAGSF